MSEKKFWRYEYMFPADLKEAVETYPVAWLTVAPLEWHGDHMAFGCDPFIGQTRCRKAWEKTGGVLLPTLYIGTGTNYQTFDEANFDTIDWWEMETITKERNPGSLYVSPITFELVLRDYLYFLEREGFKLCVVVTGHGAIEQIKIIKRVCEQCNFAFEKGERTMRAFFGRRKKVDVPEEIRFTGSGGHADFSETSLLGAVDPNMVRKELFGVSGRDQKIGLRRENVGKIDYEKGLKAIEFGAEILSEDVKALMKEMGY